MIVISFVLVIFAAVSLVIGLFQTTLTWIWLAIGSCVLALLFLGIGVLQRRASRGGALEEEAYGSGTLSTLLPPGREPERARSAEPAAATDAAARTSRSADGRVAATAETERPAAATVPVVEGTTEEDQPVVRKVTRRDVAAATSGRGRAARTAEPAEEPAAAAEPVATEEAATKEAATKKAATKKAATKKAATKKAVTKRAATKKAATKRAATKKAATKKAATKKAATAGATTGAAAERELARVRGLGPAKQRALLDRFGSLEAIRAASVEELTQVRGVGERTAREIRGELS